MRIAYILLIIVARIERVGRACKEARDRVPSGVQRQRAKLYPKTGIILVFGVHLGANLHIFVILQTAQICLCLNVLKMSQGVRCDIKCMADSEAGMPTGIKKWGLKFRNVSKGVPGGIASSQKTGPHCSQGKCPRTAPTN